MLLLFPNLIAGTNADRHGFKSPRRLRLFPLCLSCFHPSLCAPFGQGRQGGLMEKIVHEGV